VRLLLVNPPLSSGGGDVSPPLGLCSLAAWLRPRGHDVSILDLDLLPKHDPREHIVEFERLLRDVTPDAVGITSMFNNSLIAERLFHRAKTIAPDVATIAGGPHFGALATASLARIDALDYVVAGEGERALDTLLAALATHDTVEAIPGVASRRSPVPSKPELIDMQTLAPMWSGMGDALPLKPYRRHTADGPHAIYIEAGRGCPFACSFCATAPFWERRFRVKRPEVLVDDMRFLFEAHGYDTFLLVHDLPTVDMPFILELSQRIIDARLPVRWMINNRPDIDLTGLLPTMRLAGCYKMFIGVESASASVQRSILKKASVPNAIGNIDTLLASGMTCTTSFVIGFPAETREQLAHTIRLATAFKLKGVETVQLHRLRLWPPAPLVEAGLSVTFDESSFRLEYPFPDPAVADVDSIRSDPAFFSGYFVPDSSAAAPSELAQCERFFSYGIAATPLTHACLWNLAGDVALDMFLDAVRDKGISLPAAGEDVVDSFIATEDCLREWISRTTIPEWSRRLIDAVLDYERWRIDLLRRLSVDAEESIETAVKLPDLVVRLCAERPLSEELLQRQRVRVRRTAVTFVADVHLLDETVDHGSGHRKAVPIAVESGGTNSLSRNQSLASPGSRR
jgi:radical SAM superfamily enzyme YgiQ (UPF0313 family)